VDVRGDALTISSAAWRHSRYMYIYYQHIITLYNITVTYIYKVREVRTPPVRKICNIFRRMEGHGKIKKSAHCFDRDNYTVTHPLSKIHGYATVILYLTQAHIT